MAEVVLFKDRNNNNNNNNNSSNNNVKQSGDLFMPTTSTNKNGKRPKHGHTSRRDQRKTKKQGAQQPEQQQQPLIYHKKKDFKSVLTLPFPHWNDLEEVYSVFMEEWNPAERSCIIQSLLRFFELKIILGEYRANKLLSPTQLIGRAWHVLLLETELYRHVIFYIQDFHAVRPHRMLHHALLKKDEFDAFEKRLDRTQSLFEAYYGTRMPSTLEGIIARKGSSWDPFVGSSSSGSEAVGATSTGYFCADNNVLARRGAGGGNEYAGGDVRLKHHNVLDDDDDKKGSGSNQWLMPWLPTFDCFENFFCVKDGICFENEDIYVGDENVSILTPPDVDIDTLPDDEA